MRAQRTRKEHCLKISVVMFLGTGVNLSKVVEEEAQAGKGKGGERKGVSHTNLDHRRQTEPSAAACFSLFQEQRSGVMAGGAGKRSKHPRARTGTDTLQAQTRPDETLEAADEGA